MSIIRLRFWLPLVSAALLLGSVFAIAWSVFSPYRVEMVAAGLPRAAANQPVTSKMRAERSGRDFAPLLTRRFQTALFDAPPPPVVAKKETPPLPVKLLATMPEPNGGCAMFADADGSTLIKSVGDQITGGANAVELVEVAGDHVVVRQENQLVTLKLPQ